VAAAEDWIDLLLRRSGELRRAGILSIACDGNSAVLAPAELGDRAGDDDKDNDDVEPPGDDEPRNPWENPTSYPNGRVPALEVDETMPPIPTFGDD
jgi:hypothetical protein